MKKLSPKKNLSLHIVAAEKELGDHGKMAHCSIILKVFPLIFRKDGLAGRLPEYVLKAQLDPREGYYRSPLFVQMSKI